MSEIDKRIGLRVKVIKHPTLSGLFGQIHAIKIHGMYEGIIVKLDNGKLVLLWSNFLEVLGNEKESLGVVE